MRSPRPPWKVGLIAFAITLAVGVVGGGIVTALTPTHGRTPFERGEAIGNALGLLAFVVGGTAMAIAWVRQRARDRQQP